MYVRLFNVYNMYFKFKDQCHTPRFLVFGCHSATDNIVIHSVLYFKRTHHIRLKMWKYLYKEVGFTKYQHFISKRSDYQMTELLSG